MNDQMDERDRLLRAARAEAAAGRSFSIATIVATRGSTYRHAGTRLLVRSDGSWEGNISGGCLEAEVVGLASQVLSDGRGRTVTFDLTADEEAIWGWGLGCDGAIDVVVQPPEHARALVHLLDEYVDTRSEGVLGTVLESPDGPEVVGSHLGFWRGDASEVLDSVDDLGRAAREVLEHGRSTVHHVDRASGTLRVFLEHVKPQPRVIVCGAGHDAVPLVRFVRELGWRPTVVDDRSTFLSRDRFPGAHLVRTSPSGTTPPIEVDRHTYIVIMSHNFLRDLDHLARFLGGPAAYIGVLGPRRRLVRLLEDLAKRDIEPSSEDHEKLHGPAGLDIGAETPEEIAWAICAEILARSRGRHGSPLRHRRESTPPRGDRGPTLS